MFNICFQPSFLKNKWDFNHFNSMRGLFRQQPDPILLCSDPQDLRHGHQGHPNGESLPLWQRSGRGHGRKETACTPETSVSASDFVNSLTYEILDIAFRADIAPAWSIARCRRTKIRARTHIHLPLTPSPCQQVSMDMSVFDI